MAWQRFRVELKGEDPIEIQTSARDWTTVQMDPAEGMRAMAITFQVVHAALLREGHQVPRNYDAFLEVLDGLPESLDEQDPDALDPTDPTRLDAPR